MGLLDMVNQKRKSQKKVDDIIVTEMSYPTGFLPLDYVNGVRITSYDENDRIVAHHDSIGVVGGSAISVIGISGTGKSALGMGIASSGIYTFGQKSIAQHFDIELATSMQRVIKATKLPPSMLKETYQIYREKGAEDIVDIFKSHCEVKLQNRKEFTYNTGVTDLYNQPIIELIPSYALTDSFALFKSKDVDLENKDVKDITNNMQAAQAAKFNKAVLMQMLAYGKKANVTNIFINHINQDVNTGFMPKASFHMYLKQGESIPGGVAALYLANNVIKLRLVKKYNADKPESMVYGIPGFAVEANMIKSRTNAANIPVELIFDHRTGGFSKILTLLHFACENDVLLGSANSMYIPGLESVKFTKKKFKDVIQRSPEIMEALYEACLPALQSLLSTDTGRGAEPETENERFDKLMESLEDHNRDMEFYRSQGWVA